MSKHPVPNDIILSRDTIEQVGGDFINGEWYRDPELAAFAGTDGAMTPLLFEHNAYR